MFAILVLHNHCANSDLWYFNLMQTPEAILSDADGTLVNTLHLIRHGQYETSKTYLTQQGIKPTEISSYEAYEVLLHQAIGGSARDTLEKTVRLLYEKQPHHLEHFDFDALHELLNPIQDKIAPEFVKPYDGLSDFFFRLGEMGIKLAIFTSGTPHHIVRNFGVALPELGLTTLYTDKGTSDIEKLAVFEAAVRDHYAIPGFTVVTCDDVATHKPDPASLNLAVQRLGVQAKNSLVLGDHKVDMEAGVNANINERVGITHGFGDRQSLIDAGATLVVGSLDELAGKLANNA
jgi:phosphoglycolate phosphatase-like HAD superfamily hydrolase